MKKIYLIFILIISITIINYGLWFSHTRQVNRFINAVKRDVKSKQIDFNYSDLKFINFSFYNIKGDIHKPTIKLDIQGKTVAIDTTKVRVKSNPFTNKVSISFLDEINLKIYDDSSDKSINRVIKFEKDFCGLIVFFNTMFLLL